MSFKIAGINTLTYLWQKIGDTFVEKESGKGLSTNDFTTAEKTKLASALTEHQTIPTGSTSTAGIVKLSSSVSSSSEALAATAKAVKQAYDLADSKSSTDTKNTAGSTNTSSKIFLIGATSQAANPQTYSHDTCYIGTNGKLYSGGSLVLTEHQDISGKANDSAVVHLTGEETVTGAKTFSNSTKNPSISFRSTKQSSATGIVMYLGTSDDDNDYSTGHFAFYQYSAAANGKSRTSYYDRYYLPTVAKGKSANNSYYILTTNGPEIFKIVQYDYTMPSIAAGGTLGITANNFGVSTPSGYTPIGVQRYTTGSPQLFAADLSTLATGSNNMMCIKNTGSSATGANALTARIYIVYARTALL